MKNWIKRWLGITELEQDNLKLLKVVKKLDSRVGRLHNKPQRYDEIQRDKKRARKSAPQFKYSKGAQPEETTSPQ